MTRMIILHSGDLPTMMANDRQRAGFRAGRITNLPLIFCQRTYCFHCFVWRVQDISWQKRACICQYMWQCKRHASPVDHATYDTLSERCTCQPSGPCDTCHSVRQMHMSAQWTMRHMTLCQTDAHVSPVDHATHATLSDRCTCQPSGPCDT